MNCPGDMSERPHMRVLPFELTFRGGQEHPASPTERMWQNSYDLYMRLRD